jgi:DNA polymerase-3 subunit epsilon
MREIALDTETTGLDPKHGHRIVEIGCVEMYGRIRTGRNFHVYINPERDMPPEAEKVHGLSREFLSDKPKFAEIAEGFLSFIVDAPLVIHNAKFDMGFINHELAKHGHGMIPMERAVDTLQIARRKFPGSPATLDALCRRYQIDLSERTQHGALLDAELLADVYLELLGGRQAKMSLAVENNEEKQGSSAEKIDIPTREFPIRAEELLAHQDFLKESIKNPLWDEL